MADLATPNLPSRDFDVTMAFYAALGFVPSWRDAAWMILGRSGLQIEFFLYPDIDPASSSFSCCLRLDDLDAFFAACRGAGVVETSIGWPRIHAPKREAWGGTVGALVDPDGTLLRLIQN